MMLRSRKERKKTKPGVEDGGHEEIAAAAEVVVEEGVEGSRNEKRSSGVSVSRVVLALM